MGRHSKSDTWLNRTKPRLRAFANATIAAIRWVTDWAVFTLTYKIRHLLQPLVKTLDDYREGKAAARARANASPVWISRAVLELRGEGKAWGRYVSKVYARVEIKCIGQSNAFAICDTEGFRFCVEAGGICAFDYHLARKLALEALLIKNNTDRRGFGSRSAYGPNWRLTLKAGEYLLKFLIDQIRQLQQSAPNQTVKQSS